MRHYLYCFGLLLWLLPSCLGGCGSDLDCSLAGSCVNGTCKCQSWSKGPDCAALNLAPVRSATDVRSIVEPAENWTRWGGSVVYDGDGDGMYHLFAAEMAKGCALSVWSYKSQVVHAVSNSSTGPFRRLGVAIPFEAHNPVLSRSPTDGTWLLWTCGCPFTPVHVEGCAREVPACPGGAEAIWTTTVYSSASLYGPWEPHVDILGNITRGRLGSQNVSPVFAADGSVSIMFKGPDNNTEASIATAPHWRGPYTLAHVNVFAKYYAENITNEDCYMWVAPDGTLHALSHRMSPSDRGSFVSGGHAFARTIDEWHYALTPAYTDELALTGGGSYKLRRRERPQLMMGADGQPRYLYNGVMPASGNAFTFAQELGG